MFFISPLLHKKTPYLFGRGLPFSYPSNDFAFTLSPRWLESDTLRAGLLASGSTCNPCLPRDLLSPVACYGLRPRLQRRAHS